MNLKVRAKNWSFWVSVIVAIGAPILGYYGITAADVTTWAALGRMLLDAISNPYVVGLMLVSLYNALIDPTTPGVIDSARALGYTSPGGNKEDNSDNE